MQAVNDENNGQLKKRGDNCPFYDLGTADVHELVKQMKEQNKHISELLELVAGKNQVPFKIYLWTVGLVAVSITGAKFIGEVFQHIHSIWPMS